METVIYARQSLDRDGTGAAVDRQVSDCLALAERLSLIVAREFVDNDVSASKGVRPAFTELLAAVRAGTVSTIIVWHTDRLYRRVRDLVELVELAETHALKILTVKAGDLDLNNSTGRMLAQIMGAVARQEVEHKAERQITANEQRAIAGVWQFSNRPYGYERVDGVVRVVEAEAAIIREAFDRYLAGETYYAIAQDLNARGVPTLRGGQWTMTQLRDRLRNPAYAGRRTRHGEDVAQGDWEPIVTPEVWERFATVKARRAVRHEWSNGTKYLLSGLAICGVCGGRMLARPEYGKRQADGSKTVRMTYSCTTGWCVARDLAKVDQLVEAALFARLTMPDAVGALTPATDVAPLVAESQEIRARRDDLAAALAEGALTLAAVREQSGRLQKRLDTLQEQISAAEGGSQLSTLLLASSVQTHWRERMSLPQKRMTIASLMSVTIRKQQNVRVFDPEDVVIEWLTH
jgi:site-specific DNA recombinase